MAKIHVLLAGEEIGTHQVKTTPWIVGRHGTCHVQIDNPSVSRRHCQFTHENGAYFVQDMMSANGTFVGGKKVRKAPVENGTEVNVGKYVLVFEDTGMELLPTQARPGAGAKKRTGSLGFSGAERTFQMDPATLRQQMAKAGAAAAETSSEVVRKATDLAKEFDLNVELGARKPKRLGKFLVAGITLLGVAVLAALVLLGLYWAMGD